ncbi:MAG TPA: PspA/IM30 family protein [Steroidobacteraceae bacterium]|jgi:phage shock protein A
MAETLAVRVTRILAGSAHALLDKIEDVAPDAIMKQAIREIDQVLGDVRADLGKVEAAKHLITTHIGKLNNENEQLATNIELALERGEEELARAGVERQILIDDQTPVLQRSLADQQEKSRELEGYITALLAKRREMEDAFQEFLATSAQRAGASGGTQRPDHGVRVENAQTAFDRVLARQTGVTGLGVANGGDAQKLKELQDLARRNRIDERLAQLKARLNR